MEAETRFRAMGSDVHMIVVGGVPGLSQVARDFLEALEARWSRFRPDSDVSRLNAVSGFPLVFSPATVALVQRAVEGARVTGGRYDPTVLGDVLRAGYVQSFELLDEGTPRGRSTLRSGYAGIAIDPERSTVALPWGVGFDPGGIGKGLAADFLVGELLSLGAEGACVNVGGDLRVEGRPPRGGSWVVDIEHPMRGWPAATVALTSGAVATSSRMRRAWGPQGDRRHHLIDPSTGLPTKRGVAAASVVAAEAWEAEVAAKAAFIAGLEDGAALIQSLRTEGLLIGLDGTLHTTPGFHRFTVSPLEPNAVPNARVAS